MQKNKPKIAIIIKSAGLEYDDRLRKECLFLLSFAELKLFVNFNHNGIQKGVTSYGVPFQSVALLSRKMFNSKSFLLIKSLEFYLRIKGKLKNYDIVWSHEESSFIFPLLSAQGRCVWDHHELPVFFNQGFSKKVFNYIENKSLFMIHANNHRLFYLLDQKLITNPSKNIVLRNLPDIYTSVANIEYFENENIVSDYGLINNEYVYVQGINKDERYPYNTLVSLLDGSDLKITVIGGIEEKTLIRLKKKYGDDFSNRVLNVGKVKQEIIPFFVSKAKYSVILYERDSPNSRYCEPNRMFQALGFNIPIVVGSNEPMAEIVNEHKCGVVLKDDGRNVDELILAIREMENNYDYYKTNVVNMDKLFWESQRSTFEFIKETILGKLT